MYKELVSKLTETKLLVNKVHLHVIKKHITQPKYIVLCQGTPCGMYYGNLAGRKSPGVLDVSKVTLFWGRNKAKKAIEQTISFYMHNDTLSDPETYEIVKVNEL